MSDIDLDDAVAYNRTRPYTAGKWSQVQTLVGADVDGIPGEQTAQAIRVWQDDNGQSADGKCGPSTLTAMGLSMYHLSDGAVTWLGDGAIDCDGDPMAYHPDNVGIDFNGNAGWPGSGYGLVLVDGQPVLQGPLDPAPSFWVSTTALVLPGYSRTSPHRYVWSRFVPYIAMPRNLSDLIPSSHRPAKGDICRMSRDGIDVLGIFADVGPALELDVGTARGELSVAASQALGHNPYQFKGGRWKARLGMPVGVTYTVYPGSATFARIEHSRAEQHLVISREWSPL